MLKGKEKIDKLICKKIAKEWAAGILYHGTGMDSFTYENGLTSEEKGFIVEEVHKIGLRIIKGDKPSVQLSEIVKKYYDFE